MARDARLDVWRGLCLIDVVLVHLAYNDLGFPGLLDPLIRHYTRFAAGGFVFLSGLTIAAVFGPKVLAGPAKRRAAYRWLWRRAGVLVLVDVAASAALRLLDGVRRFPVDPDTPVADVVRDVLLLQRPGLTGGILLLYGGLLAAMPLVFEVQRRIGAVPVALTSVALYAAAAASGTVWPHNDFPWAHWQPLFVAGLLSARVWLPAHAGVPRRVVAAAVAAFAFAAVFLAQYGADLGLPLAVRVPLDFTKTPLEPGALLWYLTIVQLLLALSSLGGEALFRVGGATAWVARLGRHSLLVYTAHVFTEAAVLEYVWGVWPPAAVRTALAAADLAVLGLACTAVERRLLPRALAAVAGLPARVAATRPRLAVAAAAAAATIVVGVGAAHRARMARVGVVPVVAVEAAADATEAPGEAVVDDALFVEGEDAPLDAPEEADLPGPLPDDVEEQHTLGPTDPTAV
jgi:hypothetical protein